MTVLLPQVHDFVPLVPPEFLRGDWATDYSREPDVASTVLIGEPKELTGIRRVLYVLAGLGFVGLAYLGVLLPGLPATPWVLSASYCFSRSSPRLQRWLLASPFFGRLIQDWQSHQGMRPAVKALAVSMMLLACSGSITFAPIPLWVKFCIGCCGFTGLCVILFIVPTVREPNRS